MSQRARKFIGMLLLVGFVIVYFAVAMLVSNRLLDGQPKLLQLAGYAFFGLVWVIPAGLIIRWMARP